MFIVGTTHMPPNKGIEVGKLFARAVKKPLPSCLKRVNVLVTAAGEEWFKALAIYEVEDAKVGEAMKALVEYEAQFICIEGYRYQVDLMLDAKEALPLIGI